MVTVIRTALGERVAVGAIGPRIEHGGMMPIPGNAIALEISNMARHWCCAKLRTLVANDAGHDGDAAGIGWATDAKQRIAASPPRTLAP